ncbi:unnamed protein product [Penicillium salamii]|nr:unnamed protein product [Penicillium salamii]
MMSTNKFITSTVGTSAWHPGPQSPFRFALPCLSSNEQHYLLNYSDFIESNNIIVKGSNYNNRDNDYILNCLLEMRNICFEHFKPFQNKISLILQNSQSHFNTLAGCKSFTGFLNILFISNILVKTIEIIFNALKPYIVQPQNNKTSANIN